MHKLHYYFFTLLLILLLAGCELLQRYEPDKPLEPGRRDYVWKVDTMYSPPEGFIEDIWGSSPNDVWAVGGGTGIYQLFHYNGVKWETVPWTGGDLRSINGFAPNNVWAGGTDGKIYHFDGSRWSLAYRYRPEDTSGSDINDIWGTAPNNLYVTGVTLYPEDRFRGFLLHYNGKDWSELWVTESTVQLNRTRRDGNGIFLQGIDIHSTPDRVIIYRYANRKMIEEYGGSSNEAYLTTLNLIGNRIYYVIGNTVNVYQKGRFYERLQITNANFGYHVYGRHEKDIFIRMNNGLVHYNGENLEYLFNHNRSLLSLSRNAMIFEKAVFFIVNDYNEGTNYIYHGTLNEQKE